jgi:hypothetical protein
MPILESAAANVESTLAFTLSVKLVDIVGNLRRGSSYSSGGSDPRDATLFLCVGILFLSAAPSFFSSSQASSSSSSSRSSSHGGLSQLHRLLQSAARVGRDMLSLASEVLLLAFSRLVMQQVFSQIK